MNKVLLDVAWTLSYEMYFYLLFSLLVLTGLRARRWLLLSLFASIFAYNLFRHFVLHDFSPEKLYYNSFSNLFLTSPFLLEFFAGAVFASLASAGSSRSGWLLLLAGVLGFALAGLINVAGYDGKIEQGYHYVPRVLLFGTPSVLLLLGLVRLEHNGSVAPRRFSLYTGGASYAIYLSHTIFLVATTKLGLDTALSGSPNHLVQLIFGLYCVLIVASSTAYYRLLERPLHQWFKRGLRIRREA